jgi:hypothetical protein
MTRERDQDADATVRMPRPTPKPPEVDEELENVDPEKTLVREDWESTVIRRVAPRVAEVQDEIEADEQRFGWEGEVLRRLSRELPR